VAALAPETPARTRRRLDLRLWIPTAWIALVSLLALTAPWLKSVPLIRLKPNAKTLGKVGQMPSMKFWLGTDQIGRDIFSRLVWGGRVALAVGVVAVLVAMLVGGALGLVAGFYRGKIEVVLNTITNTLLAFPALVLVLAIIAFLGHDLWNIVTAIAIVGIPAFARIAYANTLAVSQREYVLAARSLGAKNGRILFREILPNVILPLSAFALVVTAVAIVAESGLAFLGLSIERPKPSWGSLIDDGRKLLVSKGIWHVSFIPIICMFLTVLCINLIGDRLRTLIDPRDAKV
jgi:peptide/nickel transport system permease protein